MILCNLKKLIKEYNVTQTQIIESTGITRPTLLQLIKNENNGFKYDTIEKLCKFFNVDMNELLIFTPFDIKMPILDIFQMNYRGVKDEDLGSEIIIHVTTFIDNKRYNFQLAHHLQEIHSLKHEITLYCEVSKEDYYYFKEKKLDSFLTSMLLLHDKYNEFIENLEINLENNFYRIKNEWKIKLEFTLLDEDEYDYLFKKIENSPKSFKVGLYNLLKSELDKED